MDHKTSDPKSDSALTLLQRNVPGLDRLGGFLKSDVENHALVVNRGRGTVMFDLGSDCGGMLLLDHGMVRVSQPGPSGREMTLYRVTPTQICVITLGCVLAEVCYTARGVVERDICGVLLPISLFRRLSDESPAFRSFIFRSFSSRLGELIDLASSVTFEHLDSRLASHLIRESDTHRTRELQVTHQDLASELGTVRERVSRLLENFEADGMVELNRGRVRIVDDERLRLSGAQQQ